MTTARKAAQQSPVPPTICEAREARGWSIEELAAEAIVSPQLIERLEDGIAGKVPRHLMGKITEALGVDELSASN